MKFVNLSGKRLMAAQLIELKQCDAEILEPMDDLKAVIDCPKELNALQYAEKANTLIDKFGVAEGDMIHINGIDLNLIMAINKLRPCLKFVYSKMSKDKSGDKYITNFVCFVSLHI